MLLVAQSRVCEHSKRQKEMLLKQIPMTSVEFSKERRGQRLDAYLLDVYLSESDLSVRHAWACDKLVGCDPR